MHDAVKQVRAFMERHNFHRDVPVKHSLSLNLLMSDTLTETMVAADYAEQAFDGAVDDYDRLVASRVQLIAEEFKELIEALSVGDEIEVADALADLLYVVIGAGIAFNIPIAEVFNCVHASNMTKTVGGHKPKGENYCPPDIEGAIALGRKTS